MPFLKKELGVKIEHESPKQDPSAMVVDASIVNSAFVEELGTLNLSRRSFDRQERVLHSHGHTFQEVHALRHDRLKRYVDMIVYPITNEHVEHIVLMANKHNVVLVPYGGGTNVT